MFFFSQAEDGIRGIGVTGVQTCALPIYGALAVFGAPVPQPDHAARALAAARAIDRFAEEFRRRPDAVALGWGATRIGVAAGEGMAGGGGGPRPDLGGCGARGGTPRPVARKGAGRG